MPASQSPTVGLSTLVHHLARRSATVTGSVISGSVSEGSQSVPCLLPSALPASLTNPFTPAATGDDPKSPTRSRAALGCTAGFGAIAPRSYFVVECTKIAVSLSVLLILGLSLHRTKIPRSHPDIARARAVRGKEAKESSCRPSGKVRVPIDEAMAMNCL